MKIVFTLTMSAGHRIILDHFYHGADVASAFAYVEYNGLYYKQTNYTYVTNPNALAWMGVGSVELHMDCQEVPGAYLDTTKILSISTYKGPTAPRCECGKDKHNFTSHTDWCAKSERGIKR